MKRRNKRKYNNYSISLRVMNASEKHKEIERKLQEKASHAHKKGDNKIWKGKIIKNSLWDNDIWILESPLSENSDFNKHLAWLLKKILPHKEYLSSLRSKKIKVDVYGSYRTGSPIGGIEIQPKLLKLLSELNIPFGFSVQFDKSLMEIFRINGVVSHKARHGMG